MPVSRSTETMSLLRLYRAEIARCTRLSSQKEVSVLVARIATARTQGDHNQETISKHQLVETHLELVMALAAKHRPYLRRLSFLDLVQEGNIGLLRAVESYDYAHSTGSFTGYARVSIRHALADALFLDDSVMVSPKVFRSHCAASQRHIGDPDAFRKHLRSLQPLSLERPFITDLGERHTLLEELTNCPSATSHEQINGQRHAQVEQLLAVLTPCEQQVIRLLYGLDSTTACVPTYSGVAQALGVNDVATLRGRALSKLRALVSLPLSQQHSEIEKKRQKYQRLAMRHAR
ncbi:MAG: sigma-70 family RNA polymerase sigma factor [Ktedonobacteraceae bacterium]|nr:sigma-70 family RNA polymerase sigma factor [Ktedonobacteraceae bacterium]